MIIREQVDSIVAAISKVSEIDAIGLSSNPLPDKPQDGDIDIFVYCKTIPSLEVRAKLYPDHLVGSSFKPGVFCNDHWGDGDYLRINDIDAWIMYFTTDKSDGEFKAIINGERIKRENGFYPSGRLAMYKKIEILYEKNPVLSKYKTELDDYPEAFGIAVKKYCLGVMNDEEDLLRAVERNDVLFFHIAIDDALDAMMQYVFAQNKEIFPSRKRNIDIACGFINTPMNFIEKLYKIIEYGSKPGTLRMGLDEYRLLKDEIVNNK